MSNTRAFEVVRQNWQRFPAGWRRQHGETVVASFPSLAEAEAECARREQLAREAVNPFACGVIWTDRTEMPEPIFADWVRDADLPPPPAPGGQCEWLAWWELLRRERLPEYRTMVWGILANLRFHAVRERPIGLRFFVLSDAAARQVMEREQLNGGWREWWDGRICLLGEGGEPIEVSFVRNRLQLLIADLDNRARVDYHPNQRYDVRKRIEDPFTGQTGDPIYQPPDPSLRYRIDEIPLDGEPSPGDPVYVVCRSAFDLSDEGLWRPIQNEESSPVVPVRAFASRTKANANLNALNAEIHRVMDPVLAWSARETEGEAGPLLELIARWGLPSPLAQPSFYHSEESVVGTAELARWVATNGVHLSGDQRVELWERMGDYQYVTCVLQLTPDDLGGGLL